MCDTCDIKSNTLQLNEVARYNYDPTRTTTLRNRYVQAFSVRFTRFLRAITKRVLEEDYYGLQPIKMQINAGYPFPNKPAKVEDFIAWLKVQVDDGFLDVTGLGTGTSANHWQNVYIKDSYQRGIQRARTEMRRAGIDVPTLDDSGGIQVAMSTPIHADRLAYLYQRDYAQLKQITDSMSNKLSQVFAQGIADGIGPAQMVRDLKAVMTESQFARLAIKDSLGRAMTAKRRATIMARTEVIRAHHLANIDEYKSWGAYNIKVKAEFRDAGDTRVCPECSALNGNVFTLAQIETMIPVHPQCFADPQTPIYTTDGWKPIGKIVIGDLVLTHNNRFRKVTDLIRTPKQKPIIYRFQLKNGHTLSLTDNHPLYVYNIWTEKYQWVEALQFNQQIHRLMIMANRCEECGAKIPYWNKFCNHTCSSRHTAKNQWKNPEHRKNVSDKNRISMNKQYASGKRDRFEITKKANEATRKSVADGTFGWWMDDIFFEKVKQVTNTRKHRWSSSCRMIENNPMRDPIIRKKATDNLIKYYIENPERRLNAIMARYRKSNRRTSIEAKVESYLKELRIDYIFQYPILRYNVDFAIPSLKIVIECDGIYWHKGNEEKDAIRQHKIEQEGWQVLRFTDKQINDNFLQVKMAVDRLLANHSGNYETMPWKVTDIEVFQIKKNHMLYNFSVEEDESYIAKGCVVHNCRCIALPLRPEIPSNSITTK